LYQPRKLRFRPFPFCFLVKRCRVANGPQPGLVFTPWTNPIVRCLPIGIICEAGGCLFFGADPFCPGRSVSVCCFFPSLQRDTFGVFVGVMISSSLDHPAFPFIFFDKRAPLCCFASQPPYFPSAPIFWHNPPLALICDATDFYNRKPVFWLSWWLNPHARCMPSVQRPQSSSGGLCFPVCWLWWQRF